MKKISFAIVALLGLTMASCNNDNRLGDEPAQTVKGNEIGFGSGFRAVTRANATGADAAALLGNEFIVFGEKGDGTTMSPVFDNYRVVWALNTAGTTASNTHDWEYVGKDIFTGHTEATSQTIKYWDFSTSQYNFVAYSLGGGGATSTRITGTKTYELTGSETDLAKCYITDFYPVAKSNYNQVVRLEFRSLAAKVRMALYETVPGYSVKDVKFYSDNGTSIATGTNSTDATLFNDAGGFFTAGKYTVSFNTNPLAATGYKQAHVAIDGTATGTTSANSRGFGTLNYTDGKLGKTLAGASYAGTGDFYTTVLPNEEGKALELRVDYTLISDDGSGEEIKIHGAKAFVPQIYSKWLPNYAYTYVFKISDNTNGWTSTDPTDSDKPGLFPITFDAVVIGSTDNTQATITTVAVPSVTTYQNGHVVSSDEYTAAKGDIYVMLMNDGTLIDDLAAANSNIYTLSKAATEIDVMAALNIGSSDASGNVTGRNGLVLTKGTIDNAVTNIPAADGNNIVVTAGQAAKFTPAAGTYAYVYLVSAGTQSEHWTAVQYASAPADWSDTLGKYAARVEGGVGAGDPGAFVPGQTYYEKYINRNNVYAVKVIKVQ